MSDTDLLKTKNECLRTLDLINLPSFAHSFLDYVTIIVVILQGGREAREVRTFFSSLHQMTCCINSQTKFDQMVLTLANPHVLLEDVSSGLHFNHTVDNEFAVGSQQVSPLVQSFNFHGLVILLPIWRWQKTKIIATIGTSEDPHWLVAYLYQRTLKSNHSKGSLLKYLCCLYHHPGQWRHGSKWRRAAQTVASPLGNRPRAPGVPCLRTPSGG